MRTFLASVIFVCAYLGIFVLLGVIVVFTPEWPRYASDTFLTLLVPSAEFGIAVVGGAVALGITAGPLARRVRAGAVYLLLIIGTFLLISFVGSMDAAHEFFDAFGFPLLVAANLLLAIGFILHAKRSRAAAV